MTSRSVELSLTRGVWVDMAEEGRAVSESHGLCRRPLEGGLLARFVRPLEVLVEFPDDDQEEDLDPLELPFLTSRIAMSR